MLKKNKSRIIISSIIILLPMIFGLIMWDKLPDTMTTHWGADGNADGFSGKVFAVFGLPAITLILHFVCLLFTLFDKKQKEQNPKALGMIFWILPVVSLFTNGIMYRTAFGKEFDLAVFVPALLLGCAPPSGPLQRPHGAQRQMVFLLVLSRPYGSPVSAESADILNGGIL